MKQKLHQNEALLWQPYKYFETYWEIKKQTKKAKIVLKAVYQGATHHTTFHKLFVYVVVQNEADQ